jgi:glyoxylase-like metal-dependent hydrolase (beta-lactamase superfamily II)
LTTAPAADTIHLPETPEGEVRTLELVSPSEIRLWSRTVELTILSDGRFRLDGGAMFGVVPKVLWERVAPADEANRIRLAATSTLVRTRGKNILIETGMGDKWRGRERELFAVEQPPTLTESLAGRGLSPGEIDYVILTHLHFDHAGGATRLDGDGRPVPAFPNARYVVQRREWQAAVHPNDRNRASYRPENFLPLAEHDQLDLIDGDVLVTEGVRCRLSGGHSAGHQVVVLEGREGVACHLGDECPTRAHLPGPWVMAYDLDPVRAMNEKNAYLEHGWKLGWVMIAGHDPENPLFRLRKNEKGRYESLPLDGGEVVL